MTVETLEVGTADWKTPRARVAALSRSRCTDDPDLLNARRELAAARLEGHIRKAVEDAPSLSVEQRSRLAHLLSGGGPLDGAV